MWGAGTGRGGESHVNHSRVGKPPHRRGRGRGRPPSAGRGSIHKAGIDAWDFLTSWRVC